MGSAWFHCLKLTLLSASVSVVTCRFKLGNIFNLHPYAAATLLSSTSAEIDGLTYRAALDNATAR